MNPLGSEFNKQTGIAKDQYNFFKSKINVIKHNRENYYKAEDNVKAEIINNGETDGEIRNHVCHRDIGAEYKNLIGNTFIFALTDGDFYLTRFHNRQLGLTNIDNTCLKEKNIDVDDKLFNFEKSIKNFDKC